MGARLEGYRETPGVKQLELLVRALTVRYPGFRLGPISLRLGEGLHAVLGPNGSGKTTFLRGIAGIVRREGRVLLNNIEVRRSVSWRLVSSNLAQPPEGFEARVYDYARIYVGRLTGGWRRRVEHVFSLAGASHLLDKRFDELSTGQKSLVVTLIALSRPTPLYLLDEPFAHLDPAWRCKLLTVMLEKAKQAIIVYTTHEFDTMGYADTVTVLDEGRLVYHGTPKRLLDDVSLLSRVYGARLVTGGGCVCVDCRGR